MESRKEDNYMANIDDAKDLFNKAELLETDFINPVIYTTVLHNIANLITKNKALLDEIERLNSELKSADSVNEWISVEDRLPLKDKQNDIECLCYDNYHNQIRVLSFNVYHNCWDDESGDDYYTDAKGGKVTHWMPLPNQPK